jgi:hypothetical protein
MKELLFLKDSSDREIAENALLATLFGIQRLEVITEKVDILLKANKLDLRNPERQVSHLVDIYKKIDQLKCQFESQIHRSQYEKR